MEYKKTYSDTHGTLYGTYIKIDGDPTEDELSQVKSGLVDTLCLMIQQIANDNDEFFIIEKTVSGATSVGVKIEFPTIKEKVYKPNGSL